MSLKKTNDKSGIERMNLKKTENNSAVPRREDPKSQDVNSGALT